MARTQSYTIKFVTVKADAPTAMASVGSQFTSIRDCVQSHITAGNITTDSLALAADMKTLTVTRTFSEEAYSDLVAIKTPAAIESDIAALPDVSTVTYSFTVA